jgi:hypothetical protein
MTRRLAWILLDGNFIAAAGDTARTTGKGLLSGRCRTGSFIAEFQYQGYNIKSCPILDRQQRSGATNDQAKRQSNRPDECRAVAISGSA